MHTGGKTDTQSQPILMNSDSWLVVSAPINSNRKNSRGNKEDPSTDDSPSCQRAMPPYSTVYCNNGNLINSFVMRHQTNFALVTETWLNSEAALTFWYISNQEGPGTKGQMADLPCALREWRTRQYKPTSARTSDIGLHRLYSMYN